MILVLRNNVLLLASGSNLLLTVDLRWCAVIIHLLRQSIVLRFFIRQRLLHTVQLGLGNSALRIKLAVTLRVDLRKLIVCLITGQTGTVAHIRSCRIGSGLGIACLGLEHFGAGIVKMLHQKNISCLHLAAQIHINLIDDTGILVDNINLCLGLELSKKINAFIQWSPAYCLRVHNRFHYCFF